VGEIGQARLEAAELLVAGVEGGDVERAYLEGAGARVIGSTEAAQSFAHSVMFRFRAAADVGAGSWRALAQIRRILEAGQSAAGSDRTGTGQSAAGGDRTGTGQSAAGSDRTETTP
jgi:hypothetical protein